MSQREKVLSGKMPVQLLQEICMKQKALLPEYQYLGEEVSPLGPNAKIFSHRVVALGQKAYGVGRSKQESKHEAAWQLLRLAMSLPPEESDELVAAAEDRTSLAAAEVAIDRVTQVRDICIQRNFPLPEFELVRSYGPSHSPVFEYEVRIRDIVRRGSHSTKKGAKQLACQEMIKTLQALPVDDSFLQVQTLDTVIEQNDQSLDQVIRTYREYTQSDIKKKLGVSITGRHNYFLECPKERIEEAHKIMANPDESIKEKCWLIPTALGLKFKITPNNPNMPTTTGQAMSTFELLTQDYDCFLYDLGDALYHEVYNFFCRMLNFAQLDPPIVPEMDANFKNDTINLDNLMLSVKRTSNTNSARTENGDDNLFREPANKLLRLW